LLCTKRKANKGKERKNEKSGRKIKKKKIAPKGSGPLLKTKKSRSRGENKAKIPRENGQQKGKGGNNGGGGL